MKTGYIHRLAAVMLGLPGLAGLAMADCPTVNFDNLALGTAVTNQYPGVTFSLTFEGASRRARIIDPVGGTTSGTRALGADQGSAGFWPGWLRMDFAEPHDIVTLRLGGFSTGVYSVRATNDLGVVSNLPDIDLEGNGDVAVHRLVTINSANAVRIEIGSLIAQNQVIIDDLSFEIDTTPPIAELDEPDPFECACSPLQIRGTADDPDGGLFRRRLYYSTDEAGPWTQISNSATPVNAGQLFSWNTAALPTGYYFLRLIAINDCDLETVVVTVVYIDNAFDTVEIRSPVEDQVVGGAVCIDGTVWDHCGLGAGGYQVLYGVPDAPAPIGPVDPATPSYASVVINDPLATPTPWITNAGLAAVADGAWRIGVLAEDPCGHTELVFRDVVVDNTPPDAELTSPSPCVTTCGDIEISGTADDLHFNHWYVEYTGGDAAGWVPIADGAAPVDGLFTTWDTDGLRRCAYTIRLRVYDTAVVNCDDNNYSEYTVSIDLRAPGDFNLDGIVNSQDFFDFLAAYFALPPC